LKDLTVLQHKIVYPDNTCSITIAPGDGAKSKCPPVWHRCVQDVHDTVSINRNLTPSKFRFMETA